MKMHQLIPLPFALTDLGFLAPVQRAQSSIGSSSSSSIMRDSPSPVIKYPRSDWLHRRPMEKSKLRNYLLDAFGPYPSYYGAQDALRMGNYNLLAFMRENVALEFIYGGPHTSSAVFIARQFRERTRAAPRPARLE